MRNIWKPKCRIQHLVLTERRSLCPPGSSHSGVLCFVLSLCWERSHFMVSRPASNVSGKHKYWQPGHSMSTIQNIETDINATSSATANNNFCTANNSDTQDSNPGTFIATSDCSALTSPYTPNLISTALTSSNNTSDIKCGTDYPDPDADFLTVAVFTFEDCIAACASYNQVSASKGKPPQLLLLSDHETGLAEITLYLAFGVNTRISILE